MSKYWMDRWPYLAVLILAAMLVGLLVNRVSGNSWPVGDLPGIISKLPPLTDCTQDPASLPEAPPGADGQTSNYLHTCGSRIYDSHGREVRITGVNWSGMEGGNYVPDGLGARKWQELLDQIAAWGYNTIRFPFSDEALTPNRQPGGISYQLNPDLQGLNSLQVLDKLIAGARDRGMKVILDRHRATPFYEPSLWYSDGYPEEEWIADLRMLAKRYAGNDTVIAIDLQNEPRNPSTWGTGDLNTDWRLAAERAGNAVLEENPYLLIFVEGIEDYNGDHTWWGGQLQGVRKAPVRLRLPNRVVYSPHDYGPEISWQTWFADPQFPKNLPGVWDRRWGYIQREGIAPIVIGEFGGHSVGNDPDGQWQTTLISYIRSRGLGAIVWALNPGWDTGGLFASDWKTIEEDKQTAYQRMLAAPIATGPTGIFGKAPAHLKVYLRQDRNDDPSIVSFVFQIMNDSPDPLDLSQVELRYWLKAGSLTNVRQEASINAPFSLGSTVQVDLVPSDKPDQDHYLRVRFARAGNLAPYSMSGEISIRFPQSPWPGHLLTNDFSFMAPSGPHESYLEWDHATLYLGGQLVWGTEP